MIWGRKKSRPGLGGLTDVHCHLLPGVDDGAQSGEEAMALLQMEYEQGVRRVILTPHLRLGYFATPRPRVAAVFDELRDRAKKQFPDLELYLGCEYYRRAELSQALSSEQNVCMAGTRYVLLEFSPGDLRETIRNCVRETIAEGYRPIVAHAERCVALRDMRDVRFLTDSGAYIQVNAGSILGEDGLRMRRVSWEMLQAGLVHLIGSDAHNLRRRRPNLGPCASYLVEKLGEQQARTLLLENPQRLLANTYL